MAFLIYSALIDFLIFITTLVVATLSYFHYCYQYWTKKGVAIIPPKFPLGNNKIILPRGFTIGTISKSFYDYFKQRGHKYGGIYLVTEPNLLIVDPDYIKDILSKDFQYFTDRGFYSNEKDDPVSANLFSMDGQQWRQLRMKFTPTFTSKKMKTMFLSAVKCCNYMLEYIEENSRNIDIKEVMGKYTTDVIGFCAFGIECNSFKYPDAEFRQMGHKIFRFDFRRSLKAFFIANLPKFAKFLRLTPNSKEVIEFFTNLIVDSIRARKDSKNRRNDFLQILIDLNETEILSVEEMAAQVFLFFVAGFESASTVMTFALYNLAKNQDIQERLRHEIEEVLKKYDNEITYESLSEMKYLGQVFDETIRMYPPGTTLTRRAVKDYTLRGTNIVIEKGTPILISPYGLHKDPEYYPDPEKFDPERFSDEMKKDRRPGVYLPFGDGPRNCIGLRFGIMKSKIGIALIIKNFKLTVSPLTSKNVRLDPNSFVIRLMDKIYLTAGKMP